MKSIPGRHSFIHLSYKHVKHLLGALALVATLQGQHAQAQAVYTYNQNTATPQSWNSSTNWNPSSGTYPNNAGDVADVTNNVTASGTINLNGGVTLGILNIGDTDDTNTFTIAAGTAGTLTMNNNGAGAQINQVAGSKGDTISAGIIIADSGGLALINSATNQNSALTLSGSITGTGNLTTNDNSPASITVSGLINNSGVITVMGSGSAPITLFTGGIGSNVTAITNSGSQVSLSVTTNNLTVNSAGTTLTNASTTGKNFNVASNVVGTGNLVLNDNGTAGTLEITGTANNIGTVTNSGTGTVTALITAGGTNVTGYMESSTSSAFTITTLNVNTAGTTLTAVAGDTKILTVTNAVAGAGNLILTNNSATGAITLTGGANMTSGNITNSGTGAGAATITAAVGSGIGTVTQSSNTSALTLAGGGSWTGGLFVTSGSLAVSGNVANAFGAGIISLGDTVSDPNNVTVTYNRTQTIANGIIVNAAGTSGTISLLALTTTTPTFTGTIGLNNNLTLDSASAGGLATFSGQITGSGTITKGIGSGTVAITGANGSSFTGATVVNGGGLDFANGSLGTGKITIGGSSTLQWAAGDTQDISANGIVVNPVVTGTLDLQANNVIFATANGLSGSGNITKLAASAGTLTLSNSNSLSGTYTAAVTGGVTLLKNTAALQAATVNLLAGITSGGVAFDSSVSPHTFTFGGLAGAGNLSLIDNGANAITLDVGNNNNGTTYSGTLSGAGAALVKIGSGTLALTGSNTYTGLTTINGGVLNAGAADGASAGALGHGGNITFTGGTLQYSAASAATSDYSSRIKNSTSAVSLDVNGQNVTAFASSLDSSNTDGLTLSSATGAGSLLLSASNGYTGPTTITTGATLIVTADNQLGALPGSATPGDIVLNGGALQLGGTFTVNSNRGMALGPTSGTGSGTILVKGTSTAFTDSVTYNGNITNNGSGSDALNITGTNAGSGNYNETVITLGGSNSYTGGTVLNRLGLILSSSYALPSVGTVTAVTQAEIANGIGSGTLSISNNLTLSSATLQLGDGVAGSDNLSLSGTLNMSTNNATLTMSGAGGNASLNGTILLNTGASIFEGASGTMTLNGVISDPLGSGTGNAQFGGQNTSNIVVAGPNTYSGSSTIGIGNIYISTINSVATNAGLGTVHSASSSLGAPTTVANGNINFNTTNQVAQLIYTGVGETTDRTLSLSGTYRAEITNNGSGALIFINGMTSLATGTASFILAGTNSGINQIQGAIVDTTGTTSLSKLGVNTWALAGTNTYGGTTTISAGTLLINGNSAGATGAVAVNSSGALGGTGTIGGAVTLAGGSSMSVQGVINLQDGQIGTLTLNNGLTIGNGGLNSTLLFDLSGGSSDKLAVTAGNIVTTGTGVISVDDIANSALTDGNYVLITGTNGLGSSGKFVLSGTTLVVAGSGTYTLTLANSTTTQEILTVSGGGVSVPASAYWTGAQSGTWATLNSGSSNFNTDATSGINTGALPGATTNVFFTAGTPVATNLSNTLGQDFTINSLTFNSSGTAPVTIGGTNTLTIMASATNGNAAGNGINVTSGAPGGNITSKVALAASQTWTVSGGPLSVGGVVSDGGHAYALTKSGTGTLILSASETYGGSTTVAAGTLQVDGSLSGSSAVTVDVATLSGTGTIGGSVALTGTSNIFSAGTLTMASLGVTGVGNTISSGTVNATGGTTLNTNSGLAVNGTLEGTVAVGSGATLSGTGTVTAGVTVGAGGVTSPGGTSTGVMTTDLAYSASSTANFNVASGSSAAPQAHLSGLYYSQMIVTGGSGAVSLGIGTGVTLGANSATSLAQTASQIVSGTSTSGVTLQLTISSADYATLVAHATTNYNAKSANSGLDNYFVFNLGSTLSMGRFTTLDLDVNGVNTTGTIYYSGANDRFAADGVGNTIGDVIVGTQEYALSYAGVSGTNSTTGGNDIVLTAIPEPGTWGMILGGFGMLIGLQRLRKRRVS